MLLMAQALAAASQPLVRKYAYMQVFFVKNVIFW